MVHVRLEECKRDANLPHVVCVVVARLFLHATTGPFHFLRRVLSQCSSHAAPCPSAPLHAKRHPTGTREHVLYDVSLAFLRRSEFMDLAPPGCTDNTCDDHWRCFVDENAFKLNPSISTLVFREPGWTSRLSWHFDQRNMAMRHASRKGFPANAALRSACLTLSGPPTRATAFCNKATIGKQIRSLTHTLGQAQIASSGQRRHLAAARVTGEVIAKSRRRIGTTVETKQRSAI